MKKTIKQEILGEFIEKFPLFKSKQIWGTKTNNSVTIYPTEETLDFLSQAIDKVVKSVPVRKVDMKGYYRRTEKNFMCTYCPGGKMKLIHLAQEEK